MSSPDKGKVPMASTDTAGWTGFDWSTLSPDTAPLVLVDHVSPKATEANIIDFFRFCGTIAKLQIKPSQDGVSQQVLMLYEKASSAATALMLTNAVIVDRKISVRSFWKPESTKSDKDRAESIPGTPDTADGHHGAPASIFAQLGAHAFAAADLARDSLGHVDERLGVSRGVDAVWKTGRESLDAVDKRFHVSQKAESVTKSVTDSITKLDDKLHLSASLEGAKTAALSSGPGAKLADMVTQVTKYGSDELAAARKIADDKRGKGPSVSPGAASPASSPTTAPSAAPASQ